MYLKPLLFCLFFCFSLNASDLDTAVELHRQRDFQKSLKVMSEIQSKLKEDEKAKFHFYKLNNHFFLNQKTSTIKQLDYIENFVVDLPERYKVCIPLIRQEVEQWKEDDLADIGRNMLKVTDKLKNGYPDKVTLKDQKDIVDKLTKMIEEKENELNKKQEQAQASNPQNTKKPLETSQIVPGEQTSGEVNQKKFRQLMSNWGSLPPRKQARALQELTQGMSSRHREAIENYFRLLSEGSRKR